MSQPQSFNLMAILDELEPLDTVRRRARLEELSLPPDLLQQVRTCLDTTPSGAEFLEHPPTLLRAVQQGISDGGPGVSLSAGTGALPEQIGQHRIVRLIGTGGMGAVYEARQQRPNRRVALKVIRAGYLSPNMLRRFEYEADVLARLEHPGIARIYEAGIAPSDHGGQPFFAMEFVDGLRLDQYIASLKPPVEKRLELLVRICQAVQHAHTKGIIHRDLKPANILITPDGNPKILDFGVARMTDADLQQATMMTESGQMVGTLPYMAPEQAAGKVHELDTSSDVYALGVIAYELLSGQKPYTLDGRALHDAVRVICEEEPSRLSRIDRNLRGDVETIVQKALEKERARRYSTAGELAADLQRYLDYEPIAARPPSAWYQFRKFARRNRALVAGAAAAFAGLVVLSVVLAVAFIREHKLRVELAEQKSQAESANANTNRITNFLTNDVLLRISADNLPDKSVRDAILKAMIDPAADRVGQVFKDKPLIEARVRTTLGNIYYSIGRIDLAEPQAQRALDIRRKLIGDDDGETLLSMSDVAGMHRARGDFAGAEPLLRAALASSRRVLGDDHRTTMRMMINFANVLKDMRSLTESEPLHREAVERTSRVLGKLDPDTLIAKNALATDLQAQGRNAEAEVILRQVLEAERSIPPANRPEALIALHNLATALELQGKLAEAEPLSREALAGFRAVLGDDNPYTLKCMNNLGKLLLTAGRNSEAEPLLRTAVDGQRRVLGSEHPDIILTLKNLGITLANLNKLSESEELLRETQNLERRILGADHPETTDTQDILAGVLWKQAKYADAESLRDKLERLQSMLGNEDPKVVSAMKSLGVTLQELNKLPEAEDLMRQTLNLQRRVVGADHAQTIDTQDILASILIKEAKHADAEALLRDELERYRRVNGDNSRQTMYALWRLGGQLSQTGRFAEAEPLYAEMYQRGPAVQVSSQQLASYMTFWGPCLASLGRYEQAEPLLREALPRLQAEGLSNSNRARANVAALATLCEKTNRPDEAAKWRGELARIEAATRPSSTQPSTAPATSTS